MLEKCRPLYLLVARLRSDVGRAFGFGAGARCLRGGDPPVAAAAGGDFDLRDQRENELRRDAELALETEAGLEKTELGALEEVELERARERELWAGDEVLLWECRDRLLRTEKD